MTQQEEYEARWPPEKQQEYPFLHHVSMPPGTSCYWGKNGITYVYPWEREQAVDQAEQIIREDQQKGKRQ